MTTPVERAQRAQAVRFGPDRARGSRAVWAGAGCLLAVVLALAACQAAATPAPPNTALPTGAQSPVAPLSTPTPVSGQVVQPVVQDALSAAATAGVTAPPGFETPSNTSATSATSAERLVQPTSVVPLQFVFPTPIAYAVPSNWRPPVLSVPLAVSPQDHFWFARPIASDSVNYPLGSYRYGSNYFGQMNIHAGIDIDAPQLTPVLAAGPGRVTWAGYGLFNFQQGLLNDPYGNAVSILHTFGFNNQPLYTVYAHLTANNVYVGEDVKTGDVIGWVGATGNATGPHLHFEVREGSNLYYDTRNPELWIAPYAGWGVLAGRLETAGGNPVDAASINIYNAYNTLVDTLYTYGPRIAHPDDNWKENFVISDLPAGGYFLVANIVQSATETDTVTGQVNVIAGQTNYVIMQASAGIVGDSALDIIQPPAFLPTYTPSYTPTAADTPTPTATRTPLPTATATSTRRPTITPTVTNTRRPFFTATPAK